jgi:basic membrane protein A
LFLTSVVSNVDNATFDVIKDAVAEGIPAPAYIGTLANSGVGIAPFNDYRDRIPAAARAKLADLRDQIISGKIDVRKPAG